jgi:MFS family permease
MANDRANNIIIPALAEKSGIPLGTMLSLISIATIIGAAFMFLMGYVNEKIGARYSSAICLVLLATGYIGLGNSETIPMYLISECLMQCGGPSAVFIASAALTARWFPKRTGMALGYTTMGLNFSSMLFIPMAAVLVGNFGVSGGVIIPTVLCALLAVVGILFIRNDPRERNVNPDNVSDEVYEAEYYDTGIEENYDWKFSKFAKKPKFWVVIISSCLFQFANYIVITQLVNRGMEFGFSMTKAIMMVSICSIIGFAGSWLAGLMDFKLGTKNAMIIMAVWYGVSFVCNLTEVPALIVVFYIMYGFALGGGNNFMTSLPINVFGRHLFAKLNIVMCPIAQVIASLGVLVNGISLTTTGNLRISYMVGTVAMVVLILLVRTVKLHEFDPDYMTKEEGDKFMADLRS